jgi:hypothetical protein
MNRKCIQPQLLKTLMLSHSIVNSDPGQHFPYKFTPYQCTISLEPCFEVRHPRCVSNKSNYKVYAYIVKHNYILGGMLFTICKAQLHVLATNVGHLQAVQ